MKMQKEQKSKKNQILIKGNGSTYCLLTGKSDDQQQFIARQLCFQLKELYFSGYFVLALDQQSEPWIWGTLDTKVLIKQTKIFYQSFDKVKISEISCGWEHALLKSKVCSKQTQKPFKQFIKIYGIGSNKYGQILSQYAEDIMQRKELSKTKYFYEVIQINEFSIDQQANDIKILGGFRQSYLIKDQVIYGKGQSKNYQLGFSIEEVKNLNFKDGWAQIIDLKTILASKVKKLCVGRKFVVILAQDGKILATGTNQHNVFNILEKNIAKVAQLEPLKDSNHKIIDIQCGWTHIIYRTQKNEIFSFGRNNFGQLGRQKNQQKQDFKIQFPTQIQQETSVKIRSGTQFSFALINQNLYGWGWNEHHNIEHSQQNIIWKPRFLISKVGSIWTGPAITAIKVN